MGRASLISTNFTGGELSPSLALGRVDIAKYQNGVRRLENCVLTVQGGAKRRPGSRFIAATKYQDKTSRLIDFIYNRGQAYILEMGGGYMRFFRDRARMVDGGSPVETFSPYSEEQLSSVNYVQKADTAFFVHEGVYPYRLQRFSNLQWGMGMAGFLTPAHEEQGHYPNTIVILGGNDVGTFVSATAGANVFLESDVGRHIFYGGGDAFITAYTNPNTVTVQIFAAFPSTGIPVGWNLSGSPQANIIASSMGEIGGVITVNSQSSTLEAVKPITAFVKATTDTIDLTVAAHGYSNGDVVVVTDSAANNGMYSVSVVGVDTVRVPDTSKIAQASTTGNIQRASGSGGVPVWRTEDTGSLMQINGGLVRIIAVASPQRVAAVVLRPLLSDVVVGPNAWTLETNAWNPQMGYPRAVTINNQRLWFAGSPGYPQTVWASEIAGYLVFAFGTADDEAFRFELDGPRNSPIRHLAPAKKLLVLTESDEMSLKGGQEKPITPTNIQKDDESTTGASAVRPVKIGNEIVFVQAAGRKVSAIGYRYEIDGFASPDRTIFASHITGTGVTQLAHQKEPDSTLYAVREDGQIAVCAYDIDQEVTGWGRWITQGAYESIATIPTAVGEDAYSIVRRTVLGQVVRYVEVFDADMLVDCGISGTHPTGQATWSGLDHLEGATVQAWADGAHLGEYLVSGGSVTLTRPAKSVQIGLGFTPEIEMLQVEVGGNGTTAQGSQVHLNEVVIRVLDTQAAVVNGRDQPFSKFGSELLDQPPPTYTGDLRSTQLSDQIYKTKLVISQPYPLPFHLLDVIRRVTLNDG